MAQNTGTRPAPTHRPALTAPAIMGADAVLRQGRAADPLPSAAPADSSVAITDMPANKPADTSFDAGAELSDAASRAQPGADDEAGPGRGDQLAHGQRRLRLMLRQCDRVLLANYTVLAMERWPDNARVAAARRRRDLWLLAVAAAAALFAGGVVGVLPAWAGGVGFGATVTTLLLAVPAVRRVFSPEPSFTELVLARRHMLQDARRHVAHLEGEEGLAWQCAQMAAFNPALASHNFTQLLDASENHTLVSQINQRKYVRLYLFYLIEADKAYQRLQQAYLDSHRQGLDEGRAENGGT